MKQIQELTDDELNRMISEFREIVYDTKDTVSYMSWSQFGNVDATCEHPRYSPFGNWKIRYDHIVYREPIQMTWVPVDWCNDWKYAGWLLECLVDRSCYVDIKRNTYTEKYDIDINYDLYGYIRQ